MPFLPQRNSLDAEKGFPLYMGVVKAPLCPLLVITVFIKSKTGRVFCTECNFQNYLTEFQNYVSSDYGEGNL